MHKLIEASIMVAIGIMVFAALLVPVVNDGVSTEKTYYNEGVPFALANDQGPPRPCSLRKLFRYNAGHPRHPAKMKEY